MSRPLQVYLDDVTAERARVELYANSPDGAAPVRQPMQRGGELFGSVGGFAYSASVPSTRPAEDYTARVVPFKDGASVPLEAGEIWWQH